MKSIWADSVDKITFPPLPQDTSTDVLIVGGGIAGILTAYYLKQEGIDVMLAESNEILQGITQDTTAKITVTHGLIYDKLINRFGLNKAQLYLKAQTLALHQYSKLCQTINCDFEPCDSYVYSLSDEIAIRKEIEAYHRLGGNAEFSLAKELPFQVAGAVRVTEQAHFHPLKFLYAIANKLPIYERTKVLEITPDKAITNHGTIRYKKLIIATHFPILNKHGSYFLKLYQHRSYVIALKNAPILNGMYVDESKKGLSFRRHKDLLLLGGGGHRTGKKGGCWQELEDFAKTYYPKAEITARWATQDCMTLDGIPYIGQYAKSTPNVYVMTGFNKWGMTNAMAGAHILCDLVRGKNNPYADVFSPSRSILHPQLAVNAFESTIGLLTPTTPRCPHLGCALKYNKAEHSWDCPCHGSRFREDGELINNPATDDKRM